MRWNKFGIIALGLALTGCASAKPALESHSSGFGDAVAKNIAAQRIAPTAEDKANTFIPPNHARQKAAREAYENGTVKEPVSVETTE
ncbi:MAG: hypothetical protein ABJO36_12850 [Litorimonas sp.]